MISPMIERQAATPSQSERTNNSMLTLTERGELFVRTVRQRSLCGETAAVDGLKFKSWLLSVHGQQKEAHVYGPKTKNDRDAM